MAGEVAVVTRAQAKEADYNLSPSRWVGQTTNDNQGSISELTVKLAALSREQIELDRQIIEFLQPLIERDTDADSE